ncbi:rhodanese-like domain-containing protein [Paucihalobacter ruber]|uniref:Rhodanese-like domain-containing protein n=1 Tax=Paucihalobacter ruber TaxID=2567861 RepID=A0A506PT83_9FLAO|nr:rhodanese-like domain-containing protein [Paucihalobacter ruber]TPV35440.1 rhodanese-like domain-containing protein [Paucihalobacter ruber]
MADLTQKEWTNQLNQSNNAVVLDVRTLDEVAEGVIPNAIHIDIFKGQGFIDELEQLPKDKTYFVYCRSGRRSAQACDVMQKLGFKETYNLLGGIMEWQGDIDSVQ